jgi:AcrR family transcriptional regulator
MPQRPRYGDGRVALLEAAARVVARAGLRGLTYRAVAAEAGVSHGAVTLHFGSRDAMIKEAHVHAVASGIACSALEPGTGEADDFASGLVDFVDQHPDGQLFQYELILESRRREDLAPDVRAVYDEYAQAAGRELDRLGLSDDPALTDLVCAALDGLVFQQCVGLKSRDQTAEELERLRELLAALVAARG